ncbi:LysR family transcriptional regulator [Metabacillus sp. RGM 3146]|uniref:LysR family transcriptional regulator n=1 Tax=Metabacillus sp. RGM 3146 TaxID=3401092 RepID=UPI003B9BE7A4
MLEVFTIFVTVAEQRHFSKAAELLHLSQPAVSMQIRNLEEEIGTKLVKRSPKMVQLTPSGEIFYKHAKRILQEYEIARQELDELSHTVTGKLHIGSSFTIGEYLLPVILAEYAKQYPQVEVEVTISNTEEVTRGIQSNVFEIGLIEGHAQGKQLQIEPFMNDELIIVVPPDHPLSEKDTADKEALQDQTWIFREHGSGTRTYNDQLINDLGLTVKRSFTFSSTQGVKTAVSAGLGISQLSRWTVRKELQAGELKTLNITNHSSNRPFSIVRNNQAGAPKAVEAFIRQIQHFSETF